MMDRSLKRQLSSRESDHPREHKNMGVLLTGFLEKQNPYGKAYRKRFVVLTKDGFHWFKRAENDHSLLFGEERGQVALKSIETVRILDEDSSQFELLSENFTRRYFKCRDDSECEEWVSAIRSAVKTIAADKLKKQRGKSIYNSVGQKFVDPNDESLDDTTDVKVLLVSHVSSANGIETVTARHPGWNRLIFLSNIVSGDSVVISTSNGGTITLAHAMLQDKAALGVPFHMAIQNVLLASSLHIQVIEEPHTLEQSLAAPAVSQRSFRTQLYENLKEIAQNQRAVEILTLSFMVFATALKALVSFVTPHVESSFSLFVALAVVLAGNSAMQILSHAKATSRQGGGAPVGSGGVIQCDNFHLTIIEHQYTSPDAPVKAPEDEIPQRFLNGCDGDIREARRRWDITRKWREDNNIDSILNEEQPHFNTIKTLYPHYLCGQGKEGNFVYYERPGEIEISQLNSRGINIDDMLRHWLFITEYQYNVVAPGELDKCITVIDIEKVNMSDFAGESLEFVRKSVTIANQHYPERAFIIFLVNVPSWFSFIWRVVKPLVHENTQKKVKILSKKEVLTGLLEHIDHNQIPVYYGGGNDMGGDDSCRYESTIEKNLKEYVRRLNAKCRGEEIDDRAEDYSNGICEEKAMDDDDDSSVVVSGCTDSCDAPPGVPGHTSPVSGLNRRRSLRAAALSALETVNEDDPFPAPLALGPRGSEISVVAGQENTENGPHNAYRQGTAPLRSFSVPAASMMHKSIRRASHTADDWSVSSIGNSAVHSTELSVPSSSAGILSKPATR